MRKTIFLLFIILFVLSGCSSKEFEPYVFQDVEIIEQGDTSDPTTYIRDVEKAGLTFEVKETKPRPGINPTTKEKIDVPSKRVIRFKVSKALKESVK